VSRERVGRETFAAQCVVGGERILGRTVQPLELEVFDARLERHVGGFRQRGDVQIACRLELAVGRQHTGQRQFRRGLLLAVGRAPQQRRRGF
jgi:hypothetical protein